VKYPTITLILEFKQQSKCSELKNPRQKADFWKLLHIFENNVRVAILKMLLEVEWRSLSDVQRKLESELGIKITLPGVLKHMKELEEAGMLRRESGAFIKKPDARKTIYMLEGKERVQKIMNQLENDVGNMLKAGAMFSKTSNLARKIQRVGGKPMKQDKEQLKSLIARCEKQEVIRHLTLDEKKKLKLWRMMLALEE
jgi:predicted transcriptional regulator